MDYTGIIAQLLAGTIGFCGALVFVVLRGHSYPRLFAIILVVTVVADFAVLIDWSRSDEITLAFLVNDALMFVVTGVIGVVVGAVPVLLLRWAYRSANQHDEH